MNPKTPSSEKIITLHDERIAFWKNNDLLFQHADFYALVEQNHSWNFQLWQAEDRARRDDMGFEFVYHAKRAIDGFNQQRNNVMEMMDAWLFNTLSPNQDTACLVHSETPGMIIDRLSIIALKIYHMHLQVKRDDVENSHRERCKEKFDVLTRQRTQLALCLDSLFNEVNNQQRTFRVYHQFKMYNDPTLNPEVYSPKKNS